MGFEQPQVTSGEQPALAKDNGKEPELFSLSIHLPLLQLVRTVPCLSNGV